MTQEEINASISLLKDAAEKLKKEKADILIRSIEKLKGFERIVEQLKENGLPKNIYVGLGIKPDIISVLSFFCPVTGNVMLNEEDVLFSWEKDIDYAKREYCLNFFDNQ